MRNDRTRAIGVAVLGALVALATVFAPAAGAREEPSDGALRRGLLEALGVADTPGISAAVAFPDGRHWRGAAGLADVRSDRRVTTSTPFAVASVSKTFVAALALQLVEEGRLTLDEPVARWLPDLPRGDTVTLRQLLGHTSGIGAGPAPELGRQWTADDVIAAMAPPDCDPGSCFRYSDLNFVVAGAVIEAATGSTVPSLVRRRFLRPLGMTHTWFQGAERARGRAATSYRDGAPDTDGSALVPTTDFVTRTGVAGAVATTAGDLAKWGEALFGGRVLEPASLQSMLDFDASADLTCPVAEQCTGGYGLGMEIDHVNAYVTWQHTGSTGALLAHFPGARVTMVVLTNGAPGVVPVMGVARTFAAAIPAARGRTRVYAVDADGSNRRPVTPANLTASSPAVSPDGTRLAFTIDRPSGGRLAVADIDGGNVDRLTGDELPGGGAAWSPDGRRLAFTGEQGGNVDVWVMDADGSNRVRLTDDPAPDANPAWSPDGTLIAYDHRDGDALELRVVEPGGGAPRTVTRVTARVPYPGEPEWSPDGGRLAFTGEHASSMQVLTVALDGSGLTAVTTGHAPSAGPAWARDGTLAFTRMSALHTLTPDGVRSPPLGVEDSENFFAAWSPDGGRIYFTANP
jgi:D-alanyl-D-alanine carboxypeptidase